MGAVVSENPFKDLKFNLSQNILMMEEHFSLERMSLVRVAISLWRKEDILINVVGPIKNSGSLGFNSSMYKNVVEKVSQVSKCKFWNIILRKITKSVGWQLYNFFTSLMAFDNVRCKGMIYPNCMGPSWKKIINIYWENICWTSQGTINMAKSVSSIIENSDLPTTKKYHLACFYCLERHVRDLHGQLSQDDIDKISEKPDIQFVLTWTHHIRGESSKFTDFMLLTWIIRKGYGCALQYIWETHATEDVKNDINNYARFAIAYRKVDIILYFLSLMNESQVQKLFKLYWDNLILVLTLDWRCMPLYFCTIKYALSLNGALDLNRTFRFAHFQLVRAKLNENITLYILQFYFQSLNNVTDLLLVHHMCGFSQQDRWNYGFYPCGLLQIASLGNFEVLKIFLDKTSFDIKRNFLFDVEQGVRSCLKLITSSYFDFLDLFINETLHHKNEEIEKFNDIIRSNTNYICSRLALKENIESLDKYLEMFYGKKALVIKSQLPYRKNMQIFRFMRKKFDRSLRRDEKEKKIDKFLSWSFDGNQTKVTNFKLTFRKILTKCY